MIFIATDTIETMQTATKLDNPLDHVFINNFEKYVKNFGGTMCVGVMTKDGKFYIRGNKEMMKEQLDIIEKKEERLSMKWLPETELPKLTMKLNELMKTKHQSKMKKYASSVVKHFLAPMQKIGNGSFPLWEMKVNVEDLSETKELLEKANYEKKVVCMEQLIEWKHLDKIPSLSNGPVINHLNYKISWTSVLKILIEITLVGLNIYIEDHVDETLSNPVKTSKNTCSLINDMFDDSDDDFIPAKKFKSLKPPVTNKETNSVMQNQNPKKNPLKLNSPRPTSKCFMRWNQSESETTLSEFKENCLVQVLSINYDKKNRNYTIKLSDGVFWIDAAVNNCLKSHFDENLIEENDIIIIKESKGTLENKDLELLKITRPQWAQVEKKRQGNPLPLLERTIKSSRRDKIQENINVFNFDFDDSLDQDILDMIEDADNNN